MKVSISAVGFAIVLIVLALAPPSFACDAANNSSAAAPAAPVQQVLATAHTVTVQLGEAANCSYTCDNVRASLLERDGVLQAEFSSTEQTATITIDTAKLSTEGLLAHLESLGMPGSVSQT